MIIMMTTLTTSAATTASVMTTTSTAATIPAITKAGLKKGNGNSADALESDDEGDLPG